jgi:hypothetical protein
MKSKEQLAPVALGFRVKSGWASAVLLGGNADSPQLLDRQRVELCDPEVPASHQPYHAAMGKLQTDEDRIQRLRKVIARAAHKSVTNLLAQWRSADRPLQGAGLVVGSEGDPSRITNPHIRAHALEGQLFRTVLKDALASHEIQCQVFVERTLYEQGAAMLEQPQEKLRRLVTSLGAGQGGPWRADEKAAALAAWLALL